MSALPTFADRPILGVRSGVLYILGNGGGAFLTLQPELPDYLHKP